VRQERAVAASHGHAVAGEPRDGGVLAELDGIAVDDRHRQQAAVDVNDARVQEDRELGFLK
jgi:hypothetical protein